MRGGAGKRRSLGQPYHPGGPPSPAGRLERASQVNESSSNQGRRQRSTVIQRREREHDCAVGHRSAQRGQGHRRQGARRAPARPAAAAAFQRRQRGHALARQALEQAIAPVAVRAGRQGRMPCSAGSACCMCAQVGTACIPLQPTFGKLIPELPGTRGTRSADYQARNPACHPACPCHSGHSLAQLVQNGLQAAAQRGVAAAEHALQQHHGQTGG